MTKSVDLQTKMDRTTQIEIGVGTGIALGLAIATARRNLVMGLAVGFMIVGLIIVYNRRRNETTR